jgi:hypothetical protein
MGVQMSESRGAAKTADQDDEELESIADELYAMRPDEFSGARDERIRQARADGRKTLASELSKLRKPTQSAWVVNLLWRDQREVMEQLFDLAAEMSRAQAEVSGEELRALTAQRRQIESALLRRGEALARSAGVDVSASTAREAQETLAAALAQPEVADEVRTGRLVKPAAYAGFGTLVSGAPAGARPSATAAKPSAAKTAELEKTDGEPTNVIELQAAQRARERREEAQRQVDAAQAAVDAAAEALAEQQRLTDAAEKEHTDAIQRVEDVQARLRELERNAATAEHAARQAAQRRDQAAREHAAAMRDLSQAEQHLKELPG